MKAIVENPLNAYHSPTAISIYVNMLNKIVQCNDEKELREAMKFISMDYPVTFNSLFDYGFGRDYMWVRERETVNLFSLLNSKNLYIMKKQLINFFHGRFGNKVLKAKYREWWVRFWYGVGALTCTLLFFGMIQFLSWISDLINYVF